MKKYKNILMNLLNKMNMKMNMNKCVINNIFIYF